MVFEPLLLATAITISSGIPSGDKGRATTAIAKATYKSSHLDDELRRWEKKNLSKEFRKWGGYLIVTGKAISERRLTWEIKF